MKRNNLYENIKKKNMEIKIGNEIIKKYKKENLKLKEEIKEKDKIIKNLQLELETYQILNGKFEIRIKEEIEKINKLIFNKINEEINKSKENYKKNEIDIIEKIEELNKIIKKYNIDKNEEKSNKYICNTIHKGIKCEKCYQEPIIGCRYKCSICNNYNLCEKYEEKNFILGEHEHNFIKIRKEQENNKTFLINNNYINNTYIFKSSTSHKKEVEKSKKIEYSYECMNIFQLSTNIYEGEDEAEIKIILKNNGNISWPKDKSKLIFDRDSQIDGDEIRLEPQKPGEQKSYKVIFKQLKKFNSGEYLSMLWFYANGDSFGKNLTIKVNIKKNNKKK